MICNIFAVALSGESHGSAYIYIHNEKFMMRCVCTNRAESRIINFSAQVRLNRANYMKKKIQSEKWKRTINTLHPYRTEFVYSNGEHKIGAPIGNLNFSRRYTMVIMMKVVHTVRSELHMPIRTDESKCKNRHQFADTGNIIIIVVGSTVQVLFIRNTHCVIEIND